jgi:predicted Zn-dependent peptidase
VNFERSRQIIHKSPKTPGISNKRASYYCAYLFGLLILSVLSSPANAQSVPEPNRERLLNGLTILYWQRPGDANVMLKLRVHSGAAFDLAGKAGTMALLGDALFPDPATREYVTEQIGGRLNVTTTYDAIDVTISGKSSDVERLIELLRNAIVTTNLSVENVTKLREARIKELTERTGSASEVADRAIAVRLFGAFPYANPTTGTIESLAKVDRADLMLARDRFLHADNASLVVIGGVEKPRLMRAVRQLLGPWAKGDRSVPSTFRQPNTPDAHVLIIDQPGARTAEVRLAVRGLMRSDRDASAASLLARIARARWQSAIPDLSASFVRHESYTLPGMFVFGANVPPSSAAKAFSAAQDVMRTLAQTGPTAAEVEVARNAMLTETGLLSLQPDSVADWWLDSETYKLTNANLPSELSRITTTDLQRVAARLFKDAPQATIVAGETKQLSPVFGANVELRDKKPELKTATDPATPPKKP